MALKLPTPKDIVGAVTWIISGDDHNKIKRVLLLMALCLSLGVTGLFWWQASQRAKWYQNRNLPPAPAEASK